jgi:hypothetical protein
VNGRIRGWARTLLIRIWFAGRWSPNALSGAVEADFVCCTACNQRLRHIRQAGPTCVRSLA